MNDAYPTDITPRSRLLFGSTHTTREKVVCNRPAAQGKIRNSLQPEPSTQEKKKLARWLAKNERNITPKKNKKNKSLCSPPISRQITTLSYLSCLPGILTARRRTMEPNDDISDLFGLCCPDDSSPTRHPAVKAWEEVTLVVVETFQALRNSSWPCRMLLA